VEIARHVTLCYEVAFQVYDSRGPTPAYADRAARLLFMTAAHESAGFRYRRQIGFSPTSTRGAFGVTQCERANIRTSCDWLARRPYARMRVEDWLHSHSGLASIRLDAAGMAPMLAVLQQEQGDPLSYLLARLSYYRHPEPIPATLGEMAWYAKKYHNTLAGSATVAMYLDAYRRYWPASMNGGGGNG